MIIKKFPDFMYEGLKKNIMKGVKAEFETHDMESDFVKDYISKIAELKEISVDELTETINEKLIETASKEKGPERLLKVSRQNAVESILFELAKGLDFNKTTKISLKLLKEMMKWIKVTNPAFFSLRDPVTGKRIKINIFLTPSPKFIKQPKWMEQVTTAAATPSGEIIFNKDFCNQLINYAHLKGVTGIGGMYKSNGGPIPDEYSYIEFLTLHEIYHIVHADHFYQTQLGDFMFENSEKYPNILRRNGYTEKKGDLKKAIKRIEGQIQNFVGDYITNYELVKKGYAQIPIGLFAGEYNYDHFKSMLDIQKAVLEDLEISAEYDEFDELMEKLQDSMDDHMSGDEGESGESQSGDSQSGDSEDGDEGESGEDGDEDGESKGKAGDEDGDEERKSNSDKIDDALKETNEDDSSMDAEERGELTQQEVNEIMKELEEAEKAEEAEKDEKIKEAKKRTGSSSDQVLKQPIKWKLLLKKMVPKLKTIEEESPTKIHNRSKSQLATAEDGNLISVKQGIVKDEIKSDQKLLFILDNSGSMSNIIKGINNDILKLIEKSKQNKIDEMYVIKFDSQWQIYKILLDLKGKNHKYVEFKNDNEVKKDISSAKTKPTSYPIKKLFNENWGGGTTFPFEVSNIVLSLISGKQGEFNSVMFTDTDILDSKNVLAMKKIILKSKRPYSFNLILDSESSYISVRKELGGFKFMSYIGKDDI